MVCRGEMDQPGAHDALWERKSILREQRRGCRAVGLGILGADAVVWIRPHVIDEFESADFSLVNGRWIIIRETIRRKEVFELHEHEPVDRSALLPAGEQM